MEPIRINGAAVSILGASVSEVVEPEGPPLTVVELGAIIRGATSHRAFLQLISRQPVHLELETVRGRTDIKAMVTRATHASSGIGDTAVYRHDLGFRETPESAAERLAAKQAAEAAAALTRVAEPDEPEPERDEGSLSTVNVTANASAWRTALRQIRPAVQPAPEPEPPMTPEQLIGIETALVNLRVEALIDQLVIAGLINPNALERTYRQRVSDQLVTEASPLVGENAAIRVLRDFDFSDE